MIRTKTAALFLILLIFLPSCGEYISNEFPDLGVSTDELELNSYLKLNTPKQLNSFKPGDSITLEVVNISESEWHYNIVKDILIYEYKDKEWNKITDKMINIGATELTLGPKGEFPLDRHLVGVLPDIKPDQVTSLRIFLLVHKQTQENDNFVKGAYIDVLIKP